MDFLRVRNWDRWQTYRKDRGQPPWIKVYRTLLTDYEFASLSDAEKGQLLCIWILAAERNGRIPNDPLAIRKFCGLDANPDLGKLLSLQILEKEGKRRRRNGATVPTVNANLDAPETETETETDPPPLPPSGGKREKRTRFVPPTIEEVRAYCHERGNSVDPEVWIDHYTANGWKVGRNPMRDWKAAVRTWEKQQRSSGHAKGQGHRDEPRRLSAVDRARRANGLADREADGGTVGADDRDVRPPMAERIR